MTILDNSEKFDDATEKSVSALRAIAEKWPQSRRRSFALLLKNRLLRQGPSPGYGRFKRILEGEPDLLWLFESKGGAGVKQDWSGAGHPKTCQSEKLRLRRDLECSAYVTDAMRRLLGEVEACCEKKCYLRKKRYAEVVQLAKKIGVKQACLTLGLARSTFYYWRKKESEGAVEGPRRKKGPKGYSAEVRQRVLEVMAHPRFEGMNPAQVFAVLLDEKRYLCSLSTIYRILRAENQRRSRAVRRVEPKAPKLWSSAPNQIWCWDISLVRIAGKRFYLYAVVDMFSRYIVGWRLEASESAFAAGLMLKRAFAEHHIKPGQLTLHSDRGSIQRSSHLQKLLREAGVTRSLSRPYRSSDNPFIESLFKTLKLRLSSKDLASEASLEAFVHKFVHYYNTSHRHSGIALLTPCSVHRGKAARIIKQRENFFQEVARHAPFHTGKQLPQFLRFAGWVSLNGIPP